MYQGTWTGLELVVSCLRYGHGHGQAQSLFFAFFWTFEVTLSKFLLLFEHLKLLLPVPSGCSSSQIYFSNHVFLQYSRLRVLTLSVLCLAENFYPFRARPKFLHFSVNVTFSYFLRILWNLRLSCSDGFWPVRGCDTYQLCLIVDTLVQSVIVS